MRLLPLLLIPLVACAGSSAGEPTGDVIDSMTATSGAERLEEGRPLLTSLPIEAHLITGLDFIYVSIPKLRRSPTFSELIDELLEVSDRTAPDYAPVLRGVREALILLSLEEILGGASSYASDASGEGATRDETADEIKRVALYGDFSKIERRGALVEGYAITHQSPGAILVAHNGRLDPSASAIHLDSAAELRVRISDALRNAVADAPAALKTILRGGEELQLRLDVHDALTVSGRLRYVDESSARAAVEHMSSQLKQLQTFALILPEPIGRLIRDIMLRRDGLEAVVELRVPEALFSSIGEIIEAIFDDFVEEPDAP